MVVSKSSIDEFTRDREEALLSLDLVKIRAYMAKWRIPPMADDRILLAAVHKARLASYGMPRHERKVSRDWLRANGFRTSIG